MVGLESERGQGNSRVGGEGGGQLPSVSAVLWGNSCQSSLSPEERSGYTSEVERLQRLGTLERVGGYHEVASHLPGG